MSPAPTPRRLTPAQRDELTRLVREAEAAAKALSFAALELFGRDDAVTRHAATATSELTTARSLLARRSR